VSIAAAFRRAVERALMRRGSSELADATLVSLTGTVSPIGAPLVAPVSGKPCVAFVARARVFAGHRHTGTRFIGEHVDRNAIPFELVTGTTSVVVDPTVCRLLAPMSPSIPRSLEREQAWLAGVELAHLGERSCEEACIEPGARIVVRGIAQGELDDAATGELGFRESPTRFRIIGDRHRPVLIDRA
jgi:hypothetical protein